MRDEDFENPAPYAAICLTTDDAITVHEAVRRSLRGGSVKIDLDPATARKLHAALDRGIVGASARIHELDDEPDEEDNDSDSESEQSDEIEEVLVIMSNSAGNNAAPETSVNMDTNDAAALHQAVVEGIRTAGTGGKVSVELDATTAQALQNATRKGLVGAAAWVYGEDNAP